MRCPLLLIQPAQGYMEFCSFFTGPRGLKHTLTMWVDLSDFGMHTCIVPRNPQLPQYNRTSHKDIPDLYLFLQFLWNHFKSKNGEAWSCNSPPSSVRRCLVETTPSQTPGNVRGFHPPNRRRGSGPAGNVW